MMSNIMTMKQGHPLLFGTASALAALLIVGAMFWRKRNRTTFQDLSLDQMKVPEKWIKIGEVGELIMYPMKGGKRKCLAEAEFTKIGLREISSPEKMALQDRVFVVFNNKNEFINGKKTTKTMLVEVTAVSNSSVKFSLRGTKDLIVEIPECASDIHPIKFHFGEKIQTVDCGEEAAEWFSQLILGEPSGMRLGCFVQSLVPARSIQGAYEGVTKAYTKLHSEYLGAYADVASYMLMGEESVKDLNNRLDRPVTEHHFRPNLVVKGSPAYSEDNWDWIKVGDNVVLRSFKYCTRCIVTTVNPDTLEKDPAVEPLKTLRKYRQVKEPEIRKIEKDTPVMGLYVGCHQTGIVRVGDPVYVNAV